MNGFSETSCIHKAKHMAECLQDRGPARIQTKTLATQFEV